MEIKGGFADLCEGGKFPDRDFFDRLLGTQYQKCILDGAFGFDFPLIQKNSFLSGQFARNVQYCNKGQDCRLCRKRSGWYDNIISIRRK